MQLAQLRLIRNIRRCSGCRSSQSAKCSCDPLRQINRSRFHRVEQIDGEVGGFFAAHVERIHANIEGHGECVGSGVNGALGTDWLIHDMDAEGSHGSGLHAREDVAAGDHMNREGTQHFGASAYGTARDVRALICRVVPTISGRDADDVPARILALHGAGVEVVRYLVHVVSLAGGLGVRLSFIDSDVNNYF